VLGLPQEYERGRFERLVAGLRPTWPQADPYSIRELLRDRWQIAAVPLFILLDGGGRILKVSRGADTSLRGNRLRKTLEQMLRGRRSG
jgi:hypothetical protein